MNEKNVGRVERVVMGVVGPWLIGAGLRRRSLAGLAVAAGGVLLLQRGVTGRCKVYERFGISTTDASAFRGIDLRRTITISASPQEIYERWRDFENLPRIIRYLDSVQEREDGTSHWTAQLGTSTAEWDAKLVIDEPGSHLAWQTINDSGWTHSGDVMLRVAPGGRGTEMTVHVRVAPRRGRMMLRAAPFLRGITRIELGAELRRFKQLIETGEIATNAMRPGDERARERRTRRREAGELQQPSAREGART